MDEKNIFIVRCGEVALKGMNKPYFEKMLVDRIKRILKRINITGAEVKRSEGLIFVRCPKEFDSQLILAQISKVFGVASISPAIETESDLDEIGKAAIEFMLDLIEKKDIKTFKVQAKRADKSFPVQSPDIARIIGGTILKGCKVLKVDVHQPDCMLFVDVRKDKSYIYEEKVAGYGGLPLGTNGKGLVLLSGGIDSPVAAWMMAKRGMLLEAIHFHSYPYTSERAQEKVMDLANILADYVGQFKMHIVNLLPIQELIVQNCPDEETTILIRRFMMKIAEKVAEETGSCMLITGENLGQVASQTAESLVVTDQSVQMPVSEALIALDKIDIIDLAKEIGTYDTSILPFEDCCTVFLPKHPVTKPKLTNILASEGKLDVEQLVAEGVSSETITIRPGK